MNETDKLKGNCTILKTFCCFGYVCVLMSVYVQQEPKSPEENVRLPGAGVTLVCKMVYVSAGNTVTQCSQLLR